MSQPSPIVDALSSIEPGAAQSFRNLTLVPLLANEPREADYLTLDEALADGWVSITELGDGGTVPELSLVNNGPKPVLLLDGEELIGAKQNRVVNLTILVAAQSKLVIPVSCVEAGRWSRVSHRFAAAPRAQFAEGRAMKVRHVTASMMSAGARHSDQAEVWRSIDDKANRLGAASETRAMAGVFERLAPSINEFVGAFAPSEQQAGALFAIDGRVVGLELFDAPSTWRKLGPKLIRSYAVDALDRGGARSITSDDEWRRFLRSVAASEASAYPATGVGTDLRLAGAAIDGAALVAGGRVVHLCAFGPA